jgi:hypothetical protein
LVGSMFWTGHLIKVNVVFFILLNVYACKSEVTDSLGSKRETRLKLVQNFHKSAGATTYCSPSSTCMPMAPWIHEHVHLCQPRQKDTDPADWLWNWVATAPHEVLDTINTVHLPNRRQISEVRKFRFLSVLTTS